MKYLKPSRRSFATSMIIRIPISGSGFFATITSSISFCDSAGFTRSIPLVTALITSARM